MNQIITTPAVVADLNGVFVDLFARLDAISQAVADHQASTDAGFEQVGVVLDAVVEVKDRQDGFAGTLQGIVTVQDQIVGTLQSVAVQLQAMAADLAAGGRAVKAPSGSEGRGGCPTLADGCGSMLLFARPYPDRRPRPCKPPTPCTTACSPTR